MLTHRNIVANLQQDHAWLKPLLEEGRETIITALPLYHFFALTINCLSSSSSATNILITNPRDISAFVKELCAGCTARSEAHPTGRGTPSAALARMPCPRQSSHARFRRWVVSTN